MGSGLSLSDDGNTLVASATTFSSYDKSFAIFRWNGISWDDTTPRFILGTNWAASNYSIARTAGTYDDRVFLTSDNTRFFVAGNRESFLLNLNEVITITPYSSLDLSGSIMETDISSNARIPLSNIADVNSVPFETYLSNLSGGGSIVEASVDVSGVVSTTDQTFAGLKRFRNGIFTNVDVSVNAFGIDISGYQQSDTAISTISKGVPFRLEKVAGGGNYQRFIFQPENVTDTTYLVFRQSVAGTTRKPSFYADVTMIGNANVTFNHSNEPVTLTSNVTADSSKYFLMCTGTDVAATEIGKTNLHAPEVATRLQSTGANQANFLVAFGRRPFQMYIVDLYTLSNYEDMGVFLIRETVTTGTLQQRLNLLA
jgi:hypothetical protein